jgi:hypothetical protein
MIDLFPPPDEAVDYWLNILATVGHEYQRRFGDPSINFSEEMLAAEFEQSPHKVAAFLQAISGTKSPQMLVMAWRILQGMEIESIELGYQKNLSFSLIMKIKSPYSSPEVYESEDIDDAKLIRHLGIMKIGGKPVFDSLYPLRLE